MAARKGTMVNKDETVEEVLDVPEEVEADVEETAVDDSDDEEYDSYKMDPDEEVWPGGPVFKQINEWKDKFGDVYVTSLTPKEHVVWRTITRFEYRRVMQTIEEAVGTGRISQSQANYESEEDIAQLCILYPTYEKSSASGAMAGIASTISQQVMEASGFSTLEVRQL